MDFSRIKAPIFYVTPDPARAVGLEKVLPNYHIVCLDDSPLVDLMRESGAKIFSLEKKLGKKNPVLRNTGVILAHPLVQEYIEKNASRQRPNILFFKPSKKIEVICQEKGYRMLGNSSQLNGRFEDKISFYRLCQTWGLPIPPGEIKILGKADYQELVGRYGSKMVIQFGHGWAGKTTFFVENEKDFVSLQEKFPTREVRLTRFIERKTYLNNACVTDEKVFVSPPAIQITALAGFTANPGGTCGRQWPAALSPKIEREITELTRVVGMKMKEEGYRGYFGLDFLLEERTDKVYISENNARLTASVPLYTQMELKASQTPLLLYHLLEFMEKAWPEDNSGREKAIRGAELIIRNEMPTSVMVTDDFPPGIYSDEGQHLSYVRQGYSLGNIVGQGEFLVLAAGKGRIITPENEIARLNLFEEILDEKGEVKDWAKRVLLAVKRKLKLKTDGDA